MNKIQLFLLFGFLSLGAYTQECSSINLQPNTQYVISAWVMVDTPTAVISYSDVFIDVSFEPIETNTLLPSGSIIDGWQQITGIVKTPIELSGLNFRIEPTNNSSSLTAYFDDIRIHPFNGNLKSFVYDTVTQRLMAELDENNYATLYEYDQEGRLIRVKKKTERGIYTIQETRSGNSKLNNEN